MHPVILPRYDLEITTDGSGHQETRLGGWGMAVLRPQDGKCVAKYGAVRRNDDVTVVELKGILGALDELRDVLQRCSLDFTTSETRYAMIWTDCLDAVCEHELLTFGPGHQALVIERSRGRVSSVTHVEIVQAILDARRALHQQRGVYVWIDWKRRMSYPEARAADQYARAGATLALRKAGSWNAAPSEIYVHPPEYF